MFVYLCACVRREYAHVSIGARCAEMQDPLELEFQAVIRHLTWVLGTTFRSLEWQQQVLLTTESSCQPYFQIFIQVSDFNILKIIPL